ncbi:PREDICTED: double zinc ribbon and ankyrin repeat-containing protein 1, partial [Acanthisitta chloris]|uniref:double zinc ribbon and ankyrin repeat-containing protein 1 n=1 Tax=Acanthisitta chloris TaxID=57068 RepID=UPI0004F0FB36
TREVSIYYTLDGSKPELIGKPGYGECNTFKYKGPITLPVGKIIVKAMAVTKDCRESSVGTKVFLVEYKQPDILFSVEDDDKNFLKEMAARNRVGGMLPARPKKNGLDVKIKPAWGEVPQGFQGMIVTLILETERKTPHRSLQGPLLLGSHLGTTAYREESVSAPPVESCRFASSSATTSRKSLASTQVSRIQRETDFLKCAYCSAPRLSDPLAHFCQECGSPIPPVPVHRLPLPEGTQMAPCLECGHLVPMNTPTCIVCESPIAPQLQPQNNICIKGKVICQVCGTGNPLHHKLCATCESKLPEVQMPMCGEDTSSPYHSQLRKTVLCSKCNRVNQCTARFCDWCGAKPGPPPSYFTCFKCGTSNQPYAHFCTSCGVYIEPPSRRGSQNGTLLDSGDSLGSPEATRLQAQVAWQPWPVSLPKSKAALTEREDKGTQTIGLFYPSSKLLEKKELELILQKEKLEKMSDHKPLLTAISPGKGYWRKQLDHVCAHLRSYALNNLEFRALIGEPRMGKEQSIAFLTGDVAFRMSPNCINMIKRVTARRWKMEIHPRVLEDRADDYEVTITLNYALATDKDMHTNKPVKFSSHYLNTVTEVRDGQDDSQTSFDKDDHYLFHSRGKIKRTKSRTLTGKEDKLSVAPHEAVLLGSEGEKYIQVLLCYSGQRAVDRLMKTRNIGLISVLFQLPFFPKIKLEVL